VAVFRGWWRWRAWWRSAAAMLVTLVRWRTVECKVAQAGHDAGAVAGADLAVVLVEGHVADPVQLVLHRPVAADGVAEGGGAGLVGGQRGDGVGGLGAPAAGHLGCLGGVGEQEAGAHRDGLYGAGLDLAVRMVPGAVPDRHLPVGRAVSWANSFG